MRRKKFVLVFVTVVAGLFLFSLTTAYSSALFAEPPPSTIQQQSVDDQVKQAVLEAVATDAKYVQIESVSNVQVTEVVTSQDQAWGTAWVVYYDPQVDAIVPSEPGLAVAHLVNNQWEALLPSDAGWQQALYAVPEDLLTTDEKDMWAAMNQGVGETINAQSGYYLPWQGGQTAYLSRSVGHDVDYTTAHYSFDFFLPGTTVCAAGGVSTASIGTNGLNFNILASRAGTVWGWDDSVQDCDHTKVNFLVIQNADDPTLFQLYMHLSQGSIPPALKRVGAPVARGQFIAIADNTGNSTGSHLHFQVEHQPYWPSANPYWATALDITFDDVDINGGRPRVSPLDPPYCTANDACQVFRQNYVSNNYYMGDSTPPTGALSGVTTGDTINSEALTLAASGTDAQTGLDYGQLRAYFNGTWQNVGPKFNPSISYIWHFCDASMPVPNGPVSVAAAFYDKAGNPAPLVGLTHFTKSYSCPVPPPTCLPNPDQITLFEDPYYQGGCVKFGVGNYPTGISLNPLGNNDMESLMVGSSVIATLYSEENYTGHSLSLKRNTGYLQYYWVYGNILSSMKVASRTAPPLAPIPVTPANAAVFRQGDVIPLSWLNGGGATEYRIEVYKDAILYQTLDWQTSPVAYLTSLPQGSYTWRLQARSGAGGSPWGQFYSFTISSPIVFPTTETVPYSDTMESSQSKWVTDGLGLWSYVNNSTKAHSGSYSWWYQNSLGDYANGQPNSGTLTSPPFSIPTAGYYLRFYYRYQTETSAPTWDQRWLQVSVDQGPFQNMLQLFDDPQIPETASWMRSSAIDLKDFAGHNVRFRFQFSTLDASMNSFPGWGIDDFSITATPPPTCSEARQDDTPDNAFLLTYDPVLTVPGEICPNGDIDYYKFYGYTGDRIVADIDAMVNGSLLDSYLLLLDSDAKTVLAENDDEIYAQRRDPLLAYTLTHEGFYFLKLKAWKHPLVGGDSYYYTIRLYEDRNSPQAVITWPSSGAFLPDTSMVVTANASDVNNGIAKVEFYWHSTNWQPGAWQYLGTDWDGVDGWTMTFSPTGEQEGNDAAFYIQVYDKAGNWNGAGSWKLGIDKTPPVTNMKPLNPTQPSSVYMLQWTGTDNMSGLDYVQIQQQMNNGAWTSYPPIAAYNVGYWVVGEPGNTFSYRMRGVDHSGNTELYPTLAETTTSIPAAQVLCFAPDSFDSSGNDNSPAHASVIYANGASQVHNYCNPLSPDFKNDQDWIRLDVITGQAYVIQSVADSTLTASIISLFAADGTTLLGESYSIGLGLNTSLLWTSDRTGSVYIRLQHLDGRIIGSGVKTTISVKTGNAYFIPLISR
jgi:Peptidase family M23/Bacterial Ig domain